MPPPTDRPPTRISFDSLPDELKVHILKYALTTDVPITARSYRHHKGCLNVCALLLTNKRMRALAAHVYYGSNTFVIQHAGAGEEEQVHDKRHMFCYPPFAFGHWVRKLELRLYVKTRAHHARQLLEPSYDILRPNEWLMLMRPDRAVISYDITGVVVLPQASQAHWQTHFPKLDELKVHVGGDLDLDVKETRVFYDLPRHATIGLRPKSLKIEIVKRDWHEPGRNGAGRDVIHNTIGILE